MNRYADWLAQAQRDLEKARIDVRYEYWEWACFTAQQATEKALKALLMYRGNDVRGHGILQMLRALGGAFAEDRVILLGQLLDAYYVPTRYANGWEGGQRRPPLPGRSR